MKSSFGRVFYAAALILLVALTMLGVSFQQLVKNYLTKSTFSRLDQDAEVLSHLASSYAAGEDTSSQDFLLSLDVASRLTDTDIIICNAEGKVVLCSDSPFVCKHLKLQINSDYLEKVSSAGVDRTTGVIRGLYDDSRFLTAMPIQDETEGSLLGLVMVSVPTADTTTVLKKLANLYLNTAFVVVLLSALAALAYADRSSRHLREMAKAANDFGHGNLEARVRVEDSYSEETRDLAVAFNNMASSLQKSEYQRQEFVANVSHELKTPLTSISGFAEIIRDGLVRPEDISRFAGNIYKEAQRLITLVGDIIKISQMDDKQVPIQREQLDLRQLCSDVMDHLSAAADQAGVRCYLEGDASVPMVSGARQIADEMLYNLCDNAIKYNVPGGTVRVRVEARGKNAVAVSVSDTGIGIPKEHQSRVFERFYRVDKNRSKEIGGTGLGLSIVKHGALYHGATLDLISTPGVGTTITVVFPITPPEAR